MPACKCRECGPPKGSFTYLDWADDQLTVEPEDVCGYFRFVLDKEDGTRATVEMDRRGLMELAQFLERQLSASPDR